MQGPGERSATPADTSRPCACGHRRGAHEHHRRGTDCALCGAGQCARYRPWLGALRRLTGRGSDG